MFGKLSNEYSEDLISLAEYIEERTSTPERAEEYFENMAECLVEALENDPLSQPGAFGLYPDERARFKSVDTIPRD